MLRDARCRNLLVKFASTKQCPMGAWPARTRTLSRVRKRLRGRGDRRLRPGRPEPGAPAVPRTARVARRRRDHYMAAPGRLRGKRSPSRQPGHAVPSHPQRGSRPSGQQSWPRHRPTGTYRALAAGRAIRLVCWQDERIHPTTDRLLVPKATGCARRCTSELKYQPGKLTGICVMLPLRKRITAAGPGRGSGPPHVDDRGQRSTAPRRTGRQRDSYTSTIIVAEEHHGSHPEARNRADPRRRSAGAGRM
jgi:hypothetical protein